MKSTFCHAHIHWVIRQMAARISDPISVKQFGRPRGVAVGKAVDVKHFCTLFIISIKTRFLTFLFLERFLFSSGEICCPIKPVEILLNLLNLCIKRLFGDRFNMAAIKILA